MSDAPAKTLFMEPGEAAPGELVSRLAFAGARAGVGALLAGGTLWGLSVLAGADVPAAALWGLAVAGALVAAGSALHPRASLIAPLLALAACAVALFAGGGFAEGARALWTCFASALADASPWRLPELALAEPASRAQTSGAFALVAAFPLGILFGGLAGLRRSWWLLALAPFPLFCVLACGLSMPIGPSVAVAAGAAGAVGLSAVRERTSSSEGSAAASGSLGGMRAASALLVAVCAVAGMAAFSAVFSPDAWDKVEPTANARAALGVAVSDARYGSAPNALPDGDFTRLGGWSAGDATALTLDAEGGLEPLYLRGFVGANHDEAGWHELSAPDYHGADALFWWLHDEGFSPLTQLGAAIDASRASEGAARGGESRGGEGDARSGADSVKPSETKAAVVLAKATTESKTVSVRNVGASSRWVYLPYGLSTLNGQVAGSGAAASGAAAAEGASLQAGDGEAASGAGSAGGAGGRTDGSQAGSPSKPGPMPFAGALDIEDRADETAAAGGLFGARDYRFTYRAGVLERYPDVAAFSWISRDLEQPYWRDESNYNAFAYERYAKNSDEDEKAVAAVLGDAPVIEKGHVDYAAASTRVTTWLAENVTYDESYGAPAEGNLVADVLSGAKRGWSAHYATAAVAMLRHYGIPARYVEGYLVTPAAIEAAGGADAAAGRGGAREGADGAGTDSASAASPSSASSSGPVSIDVPASAGHAWAEMYVDGAGWVPVETVPDVRASMPQPDWARGIQADETVPARAPDAQPREEAAEVPDVMLVMQEVLAGLGWVLLGALVLLDIIAVAFFLVTVVLRFLARRRRRIAFADADDTRAVRSMASWMGELARFRFPAIAAGDAARLGAAVEEAYGSEAARAWGNAQAAGRKAAFSPHGSTPDERAEVDRAAHSFAQTVGKAEGAYGRWVMKYIERLI